MNFKFFSQNKSYYNIIAKEISFFFKSIDINIGHVTVERFYKKKFSFLINERLNIIYPQTISSNQLKKVIQKPVKSKSFKCILKKIYFYLATSSIGMNIFYDKAIIFEAFDIKINDYVIVGGNKLLRFILISKNYSINKIINKNNTHRLYNELKIRSIDSKLNLTRIIHCSTNFSMYREEWLPLNTFDQISNKELLTKLDINLHQELLSFYKSTLKYEDVNKYLDQIFNKKFIKLENTEIQYNDYAIKHIKFLIEKFKKYSVRFKNSHQLVPVSLVHGDLQPSNVLIRNDKFLQSQNIIIDWEWSQKRVVWYDYFVWKIGSRNFKTFNIYKKIISRNKEIKPLSWNYLFHSFSPQDQLYFFLLEDFDFRVKELNLNSENTIFKKNFLIWSNNFSYVLDKIL